MKYVSGGFNMFLHAITQTDFVLASCMFSLFALMNSGYIIHHQKIHSWEASMIIRLEFKRCV